MSTSMRATRALVRLGTARARRTPVEEQLAQLSRDRRAAPVPLPLRRRYEVWHGTRAITLVPRTGATGAQLLYTHGGAYAHPLGRLHWGIVDRLARGTGATVTVPLYGLAPESHAEQAYALLTELHLSLLERGPVTLAGDSAGGALALGQAVVHRDRGLPPSERVVLLSPWLDATVRRPTRPERDVVLQPERLRVLGRLWAGPLPVTSPLVSPSLGDLAGLPPVHVFVGGAELLVGEAASMVERVRAAGGRATLEVAEDGFHDYVAAWWTPEARRALTSVRALLREPGARAST